jgi:hypothetical protein
LGKLDTILTAFVVLQKMDVGVGTLVLEMNTPLFSKNPSPFNRASPGPCRVDGGYAMVYPVTWGYIAAACQWFVVVGAKCEACEVGL